MTIYSVVKIYQGGSTGLVQQGKHTIRKVSPKAKLGKKREIKTTLKGLYRFDIVIAEFGCYYNVFEEDAQFFKEQFGFKIYQPGRQTFEQTGFPNYGSYLSVHINKLEKLGKTFCVLQQKEIGPEKFERTVVISTNEKALGITF